MKNGSRRKIGKWIMFLSCAFLLSKNSQAQTAADQEEKQKDFSFTFNLYGWASSISGEIAVPTPEEQQSPQFAFDATFSDILQNLKFAAMFAGQVRYKQFAFLYDFDYAKMEVEDLDTVGRQYLSADITGKQYVTDLALGYIFPIQNEKLQLEGYLGARIYSLSSDLNWVGLDHSSNSGSASKTWAAPMVGIFATYDITKKWFVYGRGDIGGLFGDKPTWVLMGGAGFRFSEHWNTTLGYKWLGDDNDVDLFHWKSSQFGFLLSFGYKF